MGNHHKEAAKSYRRDDDAGLVSRPVKAADGMAQRERSKLSHPPYEADQDHGCDAKQTCRGKKSRKKKNAYAKRARLPGGKQNESGSDCCCKRPAQPIEMMGRRAKGGGRFFAQKDVWFDVTDAQQR